MRVLLILKGFFPTTDPSVVGEFRYLPEFDAYVWKGTPLSIDDFNASFNAWLKAQTNVRPASSFDVRIVSGETQGASEAAQAHNPSEDGATPSPAFTADDLLAKAAEAAPTPATKRRTKTTE
jgi:hypothetical protein